MLTYRRTLRESIGNRDIGEDHIAIKFMESKNILRDEVEKHFHPFLESQGFLRTKFISRFPRFIRRHSSGIDNVDIYWDKRNRHRFRLILGFTPPDFPFKPDEPAPDEFKKGRYSYNVCYVKSGKGFLSSNWHSLKGPSFYGLFSKEKSAKEVIAGLVGSWPEVEEWLATGKTSSRLSVSKVEFGFKNKTKG